LKTFIKILLVLLTVVFILVGGLYIAISIPKKVDVTWTQEDLNSYMKKTHTSLSNGATGVTGTTGSQGVSEGVGTTGAIGDVAGNTSPKGSSDNKIPKTPSGPAALEDLLFNNYQTTGSVKVNDFLTAAEVTAMINTVTRDNSIFKDVRIGFRDDGTMEASAYLGSAVSKITTMFPEVKKYEALIKQAEGKPIYWRYSLNRVSNKKFDGHTKELLVGRVPIPLEQAGEGLTSAGTAVNNMIGNLDGFSCEEFKIDKQGMHFKGDIPTGLGYKEVNSIIDN
jgi:hypothetical protein